MGFVKFIYIIFTFVIGFAFCSCKPKNKVDKIDSDTCVVDCQEINHNIVETQNGLKFIYPNFSKIDLVCGTMPTKNDNSVILVVEAAYTGECLDQFKLANIAGDHVSDGKRYRGYKCSRNTGAFVYYNGNWKFCYKQYSNELDSAAYYGGAAFAQELIIKNKELLKTPRKDSSKNIFRVLGEVSGKLCIVESDTIVTFGEFKNKLIAANVENAIYLDMGNGWNHGWYRAAADSIIELYPKTHNYCTNWITFYEK
jgi:hypothetical protein